MLKDSQEQALFSEAGESVLTLVAPRKFSPNVSRLYRLRLLRLVAA
jgi:hypothetical protein